MALLSTASGSRYLSSRNRAVRKSRSGMPQEIERKFLVTGSEWKRYVERSIRIRQSYLALTEAVSIRVRIVDDRSAYLTIKSAEQEMARAEFEYPIPISDAEELMEIGTGLMIAKRRHFVPLGDDRWEVDVFDGDREGLILAEIELPAIDAEFDRPDWIGDEVTGNPAYYNSNLASPRADPSVRVDHGLTYDQFRRFLKHIQETHGTVTAD